MTQSMSCTWATATRTVPPDASQPKTLWQLNLLSMIAAVKDAVVDAIDELYLGDCDAEGAADNLVSLAQGSSLGAPHGSITVCASARRCLHSETMSGCSSLVQKWL